MTHSCVAMQLWVFDDFFRIRHCLKTIHWLVMYKAA